MVEDRLEQIKSKMTQKQRADMADLINNEIKRRTTDTKSSSRDIKFTSKSKVGTSGLSGSLGSDEVGQMYADSDAEIRQLRLKKIEEQINSIKGKKGKAYRGGAISSLQKIRSGQLFSRNVLFMYAIAIIGGVKILFSTGLVDASVPDVQDNNKKQAMTAAMQAATQPQLPAELANDKDLLTSLDARRVELEERREALNKREADLAAQAQTINEKLAELKSLTAKLNGYRSEKDQKHESRLEQLAEVYGSMAPNQAAPLIAKLDDTNALALLQRMTGKRLGQILSVMESDRAIELTKMLSDSKKVN